MIKFRANWETEHWTVIPYLASMGPEALYGFSTGHLLHRASNDSIILQQTQGCQKVYE